METIAISPTLFFKKSVGIITYHDDGTAFLAILVALAVVNVVRNEY